MSFATTISICSTKSQSTYVETLCTPSKYTFPLFFKSLKIKIVWGNTSVVYMCNIQAASISVSTSSGRGFELKGTLLFRKVCSQIRYTSSTNLLDLWFKVRPTVHHCAFLLNRGRGGGRRVVQETLFDFVILSATQSLWRTSLMFSKLHRRCVILLKFSLQGNLCEVLFVYVEKRNNFVRCVL
jgi:hypothetical protein